jgi:hypothetical protein
LVWALPASTLADCTATSTCDLARSPGMKSICAVTALKWPFIGTPIWVALKLTLDSGKAWV